MSVSSMMNIPETIHTGYQERQGTYTGKLAYVIYTDAKGKLRKQHSWDGWRNQEIDSEDFKNEPTSGFVLNKGVGGARHSYGWNARNEYIRVYDPRGFEFEISVANLLFILQECTSTKGKGLEGEFVYAWDRSDLVLLPVGSQEYIECKNFTEHQTKKITKKEMVEGCTYMMKDMTEVMYLGRHDYFVPEYNYSDYDNNRNYKIAYSITPKGKKHIFVPIKENNLTEKYIIQTGFTKLSAKTSEDPLANFADVYDTFKKSIYSLPALDVKVVRDSIKKKDLENLWRKSYLTKDGEEYFTVSVEKVRHSHQDLVEGTYNIFTSEDPFKPVIKDGKCFVPKLDRHSYMYPRGRKNKNIKNITEEELLKKEFYTAALANEKGGLYNVLNT